MSSLALASILDRDRVGLVSAVADHLFDAGVHLRDASFATLGTGAEFIALCELPDDVTAAEIEAGLISLPELEGAQVRATPCSFDTEPAAAGQVKHRLAVSGGDQLGPVARLADVFRQYQANIVRLEARTLPEVEGGLYVTRFAISVGPDQESARLPRSRTQLVRSASPAPSSRASFRTNICPPLMTSPWSGPTPRVRWGAVSSARP